MLTTKSQLAKELKCSPGSISRYCQIGVLLPLPDGRLDREESLHRIYENTNASGGGWGALRGTSGVGQRAAALLGIEGNAIDLGGIEINLDFSEAEIRAFRRLFDEILKKRNLIPGILAEIGIKDTALIHAGDDVFTELILTLSGGLDDIAYNWESGGDDLPPAETDLPAVFRQHGLRLTKKTEPAADDLLDRLDKAIPAALEGNSK